MEVDMSVQAGTTSVGEDHSSESGVFGSAGTGFTDSSFQCAQKDSLDSTFVPRILEKETNAFGPRSAPPAGKGQTEAHCR